MFVKIIFVYIVVRQLRNENMTKTVRRVSPVLRTRVFIRALKPVKRIRNVKKDIPAKADIAFINK